MEDFDDGLLESTGKLFFDIENLKRGKNELNLVLNHLESNHLKFLRFVDRTEDQILHDERRYEQEVIKLETEIISRRRKSKRVENRAVSVEYKIKNISDDLMRVEEVNKIYEDRLISLKEKTDAETENFKKEKVVLEHLDSVISGQIKDVHINIKRVIEGMLRKKMSLQKALLIVHESGKRAITAHNCWRKIWPALQLWSGAEGDAIASINSTATISGLINEWKLLNVLTAELMNIHIPTPVSREQLTESDFVKPINDFKDELRAKLFMKQKELSHLKSSVDIIERKRKQLRSVMSDFSYALSQDANRTRVKAELMVRS